MRFDQMDINMKKIGVIGTGTMGLGIAGQIVNSGNEVILLDIASLNGDRNELPQNALKKMISSGAQGPLMDVDFASRITIGNLEDDMNLLSDCDWIIEAVIERADIKRDLYLKINEVRKPDALITSNTSTIPLSELLENMPESFQSNFLITHFFNPPRHMRLLEVVRSNKIRDNKFENFISFAENTLGKNVVICNDRPGFIANRLGVYWIECAIKEAIELGLTVELADSLISSVLSVPKTGVFGLADLIGVDLLPDITGNLTRNLDGNDLLQEFKATPEIISNMIDKGTLGRKSGGGFYRQFTKIDGVKEIQCLDLKENKYRLKEKVEHPYLRYDTTQLHQLLSATNKNENYLRRVIFKTLNYAAELIHDAADTPIAIDEAMRLGYNWKYGPFELIDLIGADNLVKISSELNLKHELSPYISALKEEQVYSSEKEKLFYFDRHHGNLPQSVDGNKLSLKFLKKISKPILKSEAGSLWHLGDGVACLEITTKMNVISSSVIDLIERTLNAQKDNYSALVIYNEGPAFAAGADLAEILTLINNQNFEAISDVIARGQSVFKVLKQAPFPVIGAPSGLAIGGGCELLFHCHSVVAHCELNMGLVEFKVGAIPAWGGSQELLIRMNERRHSESAAQLAFDLIAKSVVSNSAFEARKIGFLRDNDQIVMNKDHVLMSAKQKALSLLDKNNITEIVHQKNDIGIHIDQTNLSEHDQVLVGHLREVFISHNSEMSEREREAFVDLMRTSATQARISHMLATGKALSN